MARVTVPTSNDIDRFATTQTSPAVAGDVANGMKIINNDGRMFLEMFNASNASSVNVTFDIPKLFDDDLTIADIIVSLAPGQVKYVGAWKGTIFNQTGSTDSAVHFDVSSSGVVFRGYRLEGA